MQSLSAIKGGPPLCDASLPKQTEADLLAPFNYICELKGKEIRTQFINAFNTWLKVPEETCQTIGRITQGLHNASLLIDDIEDDSHLRRGQPAAHMIYGAPLTINCANHVYFLALQEVLTLGNSDATNLFVSEMIHLHQGQGMDILWRERMKCPTLEEYEEMVVAKTGGLFRLALGLMQVFSEYKNDITPLLNDLAFLFQVLDDYLNLRSEEYHINKSFAEDLSEGKFSFPIVHAIQESEKKGDQRLVGILKQRTSDLDLKRYAISYMDELGAFEHTKKVLEKTQAKILHTIDQLGGNDGLVAIVEKLMGKL